MRAPDSIVDVMVDIETLGTQPRSAIVAIGACTSDNIEFYTAITRDSNIEAGLGIYPEVEAWWATQPDFQRAALEENPCSLHSALNMFGAFVDAAGAGVPLRLWGNSAAFDLGLLKDAYRATGFSTIPWTYKQEHCYRTLKQVLDIEKPTALFEHHALWDARNQMAHLRLLLAAIAPH